MNSSDAIRIFELAENAMHPLSMEEAATALGYKSSRGAARAIKCAYDYFDNCGESRKSAIIARSFVNKSGAYSW